MTKVLLIGCGKMGSALLTCWTQKRERDARSITVVEPNKTTRIKNVSYVKQISELPEDFKPDIVVIAVKPQQLDETLPHLAARFKTSPVYLSIAAGKTLSYYERHLGKGAAIVRAMPNTPAMVGEAMTALIGSKKLTSKGRQLTEKLMGEAGETLWLKDEKHMDAVTAISGSGPAYFFYIMECLVKAGVKQGLSEKDATLLAKQTCVGSASYAFQSDEKLSTLRENVTSPGGTTAAALAVFQKDKALEKLVDSAVSAAVKRAREL
jgi:pyrroline-5-carboxylate reductase